MAGFIQKQSFILIGIALILTSSILNTKSEYNPEYEGSNDIREEYIAHDLEKSRDVIVYEKSRNTVYRWSEGIADQLWINIGDGENEIKPNGTFYSEELAEYNIILAYPLNISGLKIRDIRVSMSSMGAINLKNNLHQWFVCPMQLFHYQAAVDIKFINSDGGFLVVQWETEIYVDYYSEELKMQVQVFPNGSVMFVYKKIPLRSTSNFKKHFVFFNVDNAFGFVFTDILPDGIEARLEILFKIKSREIREGSVLIFEAVPFCPNFRTCESCSEAKITMKDTGEKIPCVWCPGIERCSSKKDFLHKYWLSNDCEDQEISDPRHCPKQEVKSVLNGFNETDPTEEKAEESGLLFFQIFWYMIFLLLFFYFSRKYA